MGGSVDFPYKDRMRSKIIILLLLISAMGCVKGSTIYTKPAFQLVENFGSIDIVLDPSEPVKAWELEIRFNPSIIQISNVSIGNFFKNYSTFITPNMVIDNINGSITKSYGLVLGQGNISEKGTILKINYTALDLDGATDIKIEKLGITNETQYLDHIKNDGRVQVWYEFRPWDINEDNNVDITDVSTLIYHYGEICYNDPWDIIIDGKCNIGDVSALTSHYGETY